MLLGLKGPNNLVMVTDLGGKTIASYAVDRHEPDRAALACYDGEGFTFVTAYAEKKLYLLKPNLQ